MSEYWKSTPSYWCKFCSTYVRDTPVERKNHEASGKHQGGIQRNLRELSKSKQREEWDKQRAKDEVARLNGLVGGAGSRGAAAAVTGGEKAAQGGKGQAAPPPVARSAAQRKAHAEQLAAMGIALPDELKREVTGVGGWQTVSERVVEVLDQPRSLADIKNEEESKEDVKDGLIRGVYKRKVEDEEEEAAGLSRRKAWGSSLKTYPGAAGPEGEDGEDLDALLSGVGKKKAPSSQSAPAAETTPDTSRLEDDENTNAAPAKQEAAAPTPTALKDEDGVGEASLDAIPPAVVFKKRKTKR